MNALTPEYLLQKVTELNDSLKRAFDQIQELDDRIGHVHQRAIDKTDDVLRDLRSNIRECERRIGNVEDDVRRLNR